MKVDLESSVTEAQELELVVPFFLAKGYEILRSVRIRTWKPDVVAVKGNELVIVEVKGSNSDVRTGLLQVGVYSNDATYAYLAVPKHRLDGKLIEAARALGIGILAVHGKVTVAVKPTMRSPRPSLLKRVQHMARKPPSTPPARRKRNSLPLDRLVRHRKALSIILANPGRSFTIREWSRDSGTSYSTTWRLADDLRSLGLLATQKVGKSQLVTVNPNSPLIGDLRRLGEVDLSPHREAAMRFARLASELSQVRRIVLFGSVARGEVRAGSDIDVAVFLARRAKATAERLYELADRVSEETRLKLMPMVVLPNEFDGSNPLRRALRSGEVLYERNRGSGDSPVRG